MLFVKSIPYHYCCWCCCAADFFFRMQLTHTSLSVLHFSFLIIIISVDFFFLLFFGKYYLSIFFLHSGHCIAPCSSFNVTAIMNISHSSQPTHFQKRNNNNNHWSFFSVLMQGGKWFRISNEGGKKANVLLIRNGTRTRNFSPLNGFCHDLRYKKTNGTNERNKLSPRWYRIRNGDTYVFSLGKIFVWKKKKISSRRRRRNSRIAKKKFLIFEIQRQVCLSI